jgi:hypothetical protein
MSGDCHLVMCCEKCIAENDRLRYRIYRALKAAPKDPDQVYLRNLPGRIRAMVRALKGKEE